MITNYLRLEDASLAPDALFARGAAEAAAMIDTLAARAQRRGRLRGRAVRFALSRARALAGARELPKFYLILAVAAVRRQLTLVGAELAARGRARRQGRRVLRRSEGGRRRARRAGTSARWSRRAAPPTTSSCGAATCRA